MAFTHDTTLRQRIYGIWLQCATSVSWTAALPGVKIGYIEESPELKTAEGETVKISTGAEVVTSQVANFSCTLLGVTDDNYAALNELINQQTTVTFQETGAVLGEYNAKFVITGMVITPNLEVVGNASLKITLTGKREVAPGTGITYTQALVE